VSASPEYVASLFKYLYQDEQQTKEYPLAPSTAMISDSVDGNCQPFPREGFAFQGSGGDKEKETNSIQVEFLGYKMVDEEMAYYGPSYEYNDLFSDHYGDNAHHSAWMSIFQQTMLAFGQRDIEIGGGRAKMWPNLGGKVTQAFIGSPAQDYKNLGRMLQLVTNQPATQDLVKNMSDDELRKILDATPKSPVLVIPEKSNRVEKLDGHRIWVPSKESSDEWSFINPLDKEKNKVTLKLNEFKDLAEEIAYLKDHKALEV
jgi:hypothetical protein